ncbi:MAG: peptidoglycan endopeptidase [Lachnospiraceae bacterium]|nr:peptidoglycan endopeptidase [Lachnospiraceae bacterium]
MRKDFTQLITKILHNCVDSVTNYWYTHKGALCTVMEDYMKFTNINKEIIAGVSAALAACLLITSIPFEFTGSLAEDTEISNIQSSAGANSSMNNSDDSLSAGANGALGGTVGIVGSGDNTVGQPSDGTENEEDTETGAEGADTPDEPVVEYETFGYTNLGLASVEGNLNVRKKASTSGSVVGKLTNYDACEILGEENGWYKIKSGKVEGYVSAEYIITGEEALKIAQTEARYVATVTTASLRVRQKPTTDAKKLDSVAKGEELTVVAILDGWVQVEVDGYKEAYVSADYVKVEKKLKTGSTMDELKYGDEISQVRIDLVNFALKYVGGKYVWGGTKLGKGVDCSGFTQQVYKKFGISIPRTSYTQPNGKGAKKIKSSQAKPGDLFFYGDSDGINHVAIYIGNGKIVHAANKKDGIKISNAFYRKPKCVVSYFND